MLALQSLLLFILGLGIALPLTQQKPAPKTKPDYFGMTIMMTFVEKCCSDTPGEPQPTGEVGIIAHSVDNWYFSLSCQPRLYSPFDKNFKVEAELTDEQKEIWNSVAVASFDEQIKHGEWMYLYRIGDITKPAKQWEKVGYCQILGKIENVADIFGIVVNSSVYTPSKKTTGYTVNAISEHTPIDSDSVNESLILWCEEGVQRPCVSVKPGFYYGVRNGSQLRLCDGNLKLISTFRIVSEDANSQ
jgi:hypothetical protein